MKYLGKKSLSSFLHGFLRVIWHFVLVVSIAAVIFGVVILFVVPADAQCMAEISKGLKTTPEKIVNLHIALKILIFPYFITIVVLMLEIIRKARYLFDNLRKNVVFNQDNVSFLSKISKLLIAVSILTFSLSTLITSLFLLVLCAIFRRGTELQEENNLTI